MPKAIDLKEGAEITLEKGTDNANVNVTDTNGVAVDSGEDEITIKVGADKTASELTTSSKEDITADVTEDENDATDETAIPFEVKATIVYNEKTWNDAKKDGYVPVPRLGDGHANAGEVPTWAEFMAGGQSGQYTPLHGITTFPWLLVKVSTVEEINNENITLWAEVSKDGEVIWTSSTDWDTDTDGTPANGKAVTMHWDMARDRADGTSNKLDQDYADVGGAYTVKINWTIGNATKVPDTQAGITASAGTYTIPAIITENLTTGGQQVTVDNVAKTIKVTKAIEKTEDNADLTLPDGTTKIWEFLGEPYVKAIVLEINQVEAWKDLQVTYPNAPTGADDTFGTGGKTWAIIGLKSGTQENFTVILSGQAEKSANTNGDNAFDEGNKLSVQYKINWGTGVKAGIDESGASTAGE